MTITPVSSFVATDESTTSSGYVDLTTTSDTVTTDVGASGKVLVFTHAKLSGDGSSPMMSYALSGANTRSADDPHRVLDYVYPFNANQRGVPTLETGLTAGSTTFKLKYRISPSTAAHFAKRYIAAIPLEALTYQSSSPSAAAAAYVATGESLAGTGSYGDLATTTDTVTVTIGASGRALVVFSSFLSGNAGGSQYVSYALSGANTRSADDAHAIVALAAAGTAAKASQFGVMHLETGLTPGSTTFKLKYKNTTATGSFFYRRIGVIPL